MPRPRRSAPRPRPTTPDPEVGREVELEIGPVAHGGHCVARLDGRVVFVRHTLPGERVRARVTETGSRFWRADAVDVLEASPDRVPSAWPEAGPGGVGGGELAHVALPAQRRWKAAVLAEQLQRLARLERDVVVEGAPGDDERGGLGYRTRVDLVADADGRAGMRRFRSHDVVQIEVF
ncbi:TRAM domain-containing protein, partial [Isoptericola sp. NPDC060257]|uniref:TRAM domain-containing protein n=1 Tax=Isoptericola sp. NPDC060257 TaxID=3347087 RepID=UPI003666AEA4